MSTNEANTKDEVLELKFTEWEADTILKTVDACQFPGTHVDLAARLKVKIQDAVKNYLETKKK